MNFKGLKEIKVNVVENEIEKVVKNTYTDVSNHIKNLEFRAAIENIIKLVEYGNKYYDEKKPWVLFKEDINEFNKVIYNCAYIIANLSNLFEPVMPETSNKIKKYLNIDSNMWDEIKLVNDIKSNGIAPLFERIK